MTLSLNVNIINPFSIKPVMIQHAERLHSGRYPGSMAIIGSMLESDASASPAHSQPPEPSCDQRQGRLEPKQTVSCKQDSMPNTGRQSQSY